MFRSLKSALTVHSPSLIAIAAMISIMLFRRPWPQRVPVHFDFQWHPDRWGSPWESIVFLILATFITFAAISTSVMWSRREDGRKRFNLTLPIIVAPLGAIVGIHFWYWSNLPELASQGHAPSPWLWLALCAVILATCSTILEYFRTPIPDENA